MAKGEGIAGTAGTPGGYSATQTTAAQNYNQTPSVIEAIGAQFPELLNYLQIPDVFNLLVQATQDVSGQWTGTRFATALQGTDWWKSTPPSARQWQATRLSDPARAAQLEDQTAQSVRSIAGQMGIPLTGNELIYITEAALSQGMEPQRIQQELVDFSRTKKLRPGQISATASAFGATAAQYGVPVSDGSLRTWAERVNKGVATAEGFEEAMRQQAKRAYPTLEKELDAGMTVRQIADPYLQIAGEMLGVDANQLSLRDPKWQRALQNRDPKTGVMTGPTTYLDWQRTVMQDPAYGWDHSAKANEAANEMISQLGEMFGIGAM